MSESSATRSQEPVVLRDPRTVRALAHPARLAVLDELFAGRQLTATECAEIVGVSPSAMSYHLRALARAGLVVPADSGEDARRRPWRAAGSHLEVRLDDSAGAAGAALASGVLDQVTSGLRAWLAGAENEDEAWRDVSGLTAGTLWLELDEARELAAALAAAIERWGGRAPSDRPPGARRMRVATLVFPVDSAEGDVRPSGNE